MTPIDVTIEWGEGPRLEIDFEEGLIRVRAHPGLSEGQVTLACEELGQDGPPVLEAWRRKVGLSASSLAM
jgi:hypothetical protein